MHAEQRRRYADLRDRREIAHGIVGHVPIEARIDGVRGDRRHQQRVAVGRRLRDLIGADIAARAHPVVHHELLAQQLSHLRAHDARDGVGRTTGGEGDDHANRFGRIFVLGVRGRAHEGCARKRKHRGKEQSADASLHAILPGFQRCYHCLLPCGSHQSGGPCVRAGLAPISGPAAVVPAKAGTRDLMPVLMDLCLPRD